MFCSPQNVSSSPSLPPSFFCDPDPDVRTSSCPDTVEKKKLQGLLPRGIVWKKGNENPAEKTFYQLFAFGSFNSDRKATGLSLGSVLTLHRSNYCVMEFKVRDITRQQYRIKYLKNGYWTVVSSKEHFIFNEYKL